jgi:transposase
MGHPLSSDLRDRALAAVDGGMSRRAAAERFGVSAASVIRWDQRRRQEGHARPRAQGGDRNSHRIEAHAVFILEAVRLEPDITLEELRALMAGRGIGVAASTLWRFFRRHDVTLKKRPGTPRSRTVPTS